MVLAPAIHKLLLGVPSAARLYLKEITASRNFMPNDTLAHSEFRGSLNTKYALLAAVAFPVDCPRAHFAGDPSRQAYDAVVVLAT